MIPVATNPVRAVVSPTDSNTVYVSHVAACPPLFTRPCISVITGNMVTQIKSVPSAPAGLAVTPDGQELWVTLPGQNSIAIYDLPSLALHNFGTAPNPIPVGSVPTAVAFDLGGRAYVTNSTSSGTVKTILIATGVILSSTAVGSNPAGVVVASNTVFVTNEFSNSVSYFSAGGGPVGTIIVGGNPIYLARSSDGSTVYVANTAQSTGGLSIINVATKAVQSVATGNTPVGVAVLSSSGVDYVYVSNASDSTVNKYSAVGTLLQTIPVGTWPVGLVAAGGNIYVPNEFSNTVSGISFF
jgi:DNA-binding beta-propeller fold protein YncE